MRWKTRREMGWKLAIEPEEITFPFKPPTLTEFSHAIAVFILLFSLHLVMRVGAFLMVAAPKGPEGYVVKRSIFQMKSLSGRGAAFHPSGALHGDS